MTDYVYPDPIPLILVSDIQEMQTAIESHGARAGIELGCPIRLGVAEQSQTKVPSQPLDHIWASDACNEECDEKLSWIALPLLDTQRSSSQSPRIELPPGLVDSTSSAESSQDAVMVLYITAPVNEVSLPSVGSRDTLYYLCQREEMKDFFAGRIAYTPPIHPWGTPLVTIPTSDTNDHRQGEVHRVTNFREGFAFRTSRDWVSAMGRVFSFGQEPVGGHPGPFEAFHADSKCMQKGCSNWQRKVIKKCERCSLLLCDDCIPNKHCPGKGHPGPFEAFHADSKCMQKGCSNWQRKVIKKCERCDLLLCDSCIPDKHCPGKKKQK